MARLDNLNLYEIQILEKLCTNKKIQHLLDNKDPKYNPNNLHWTRIIPEVYYPKSTENAEVYITFGISGNVVSKTEKQLTIDFYVYCHDSLMRTTQGKRTTLIAATIDEIFNGTNDIALGIMNLVDFNGNFSVGHDYHGYQLTYTVNDFNQLSNSSGLTYAK